MTNGRLSLVLLYEPAAVKQQPLPLARVVDSRLAADVARQAIADADARADALADTDIVLGEVERAEANKLRDVLAVLLPGLFPLSQGRAPETVM
jgi:hypothetical protein